MKQFYIGVMSGTSLDGIDTVLVDFDNNQSLVLSKYTHDIPEDIKNEILSMCQGQMVTLKALGSLDHRLGLLFSDAINTLVKVSGRSKDEVIAIGCHGQTVWHQPDGEYHFTMQIGDSNLIVEKTGITVVGDFRRRDMAVGGHGAPLVPIYHKYAFQHPEENRVILNIGGISNITVLNRGNDDNIIGYDTGPGNILSDAWMSKYLNQPYDKDGSYAGSGEICQKLLDILLSNSYFSQKAPKSTGRELFNIEWITQHVIHYRNTVAPLSDQDVMATIVELTVESISREVERFDCQTLIVCGGGAKNKYLMQRIAHRLDGTKVAKSKEYGIDGDLIESLAFAYLAKCTMNHKPGNIPSVTGASKSTVLGSVHFSKTIN